MKGIGFKIILCTVILLAITSKSVAKFSQAEYITGNTIWVATWQTQNSEVTENIQTSVTNNTIESTQQSVTEVTTEEPLQQEEIPTEIPSYPVVLVME